MYLKHWNIMRIKVWQAPFELKLAKIYNHLQKLSKLYLVWLVSLAILICTSLMLLTCWEFTICENSNIGEMHITPDWKVYDYLKS